jgi:hypothetical protein
MHFIQAVIDIAQGLGIGFLAYLGTGLTVSGLLYLLKKLPC